MKLLLHIGTKKTGTTSIQHFLKQNREKLLENKIYIPQSPMVAKGNHRWVAVFAYNASRIDDLIIGQQFKNNQERSEKIRKRKDQFLSECQEAKATCNTMILSSEQFHSRLQSQEEIQRLYSTLNPIFEEIEIILYIRDPLKMAVSSLSTTIKAGGIDSTLNTPSSQDLEGNHYKTINQWEKNFPEAKITVRRFEKSRLIDGDIVSDFCSQIAANFHKKDYTFFKPTNSTLSLTGMALLRRLNFKFPRFTDNKPNPIRKTIVEFVENNTDDGSEFLPCEEEFKLYEDYFAEPNEKVRSRYFPEERYLFESQTKLATDKINLENIKIKPEIYEQVIENLWENKRKLELKLRSTKSK